MQCYLTSSFRKSVVVALVFLVSLPILKAQENKPTFSLFESRLFELPKDSVPLGYRSYIEELEPLKTFVMKELKVQEKDYLEPFPNVELVKWYGLIFRSRVTVPVDGMYEFITISDDGSRVWVNHEEIINNDGPHGMEMKRDTILLTAGSHPLKIWYYQAYPSRYGFIFDANYVGPPNYIRDSIMWNGDLLFAFDEDQLSKKGISILDSLITNLNHQKVGQIQIIGHTDDIGAANYNYNLSLRRARRIEDYIQKNVNAKIEFESIGLGEEHPRVPNTSSKNRAQNRRVELVLKS